MRTPTCYTVSYVIRISLRYRFDHYWYAAKFKYGDFEWPTCLLISREFLEGRGGGMLKAEY